MEGVVKRAKEMAIERAIEGEELVIKASDLVNAMETEFIEGSLLPAEANLEDWLQLLDIDPHQVVRVRRPKDSDSSANYNLNRAII